jgi:hypothetical protein
LELGAFIEMAPVTFLDSPKRWVQEEAEVRLIQHFQAGGQEFVAEFGHRIAPIMEPHLVVDIVEPLARWNLDYGYPTRLQYPRHMGERQIVAFNVLEYVQQQDRINAPVWQWALSKIEL